MDMNVNVNANMDGYGNVNVRLDCFERKKIREEIRGKGKIVFFFIYFVCFFF